MRYLTLIISALSLATQTDAPLSTAPSFAALAGSALISTGDTAINGDIGVYPYTSTTGSPPATISTQFRHQYARSPKRSPFRLQYSRLHDTHTRPHRPKSRWSDLNSQRLCLYQLSTIKRHPNPRRRWRPQCGIHFSTREYPHDRRVLLYSPTYYAKACDVCLLANRQLGNNRFEHNFYRCEDGWFSLVGAWGDEVSCSALGEEEEETEEVGWYWEAMVT